jgi:hypothetical protein
MAPDPSKLSPSPPSTPHTPLTPPLTPGTRQHVQSQSNILRFPLSEDLVTGDHFVMVNPLRCFRPTLSNTPTDPRHPKRNSLRRAMRRFSGMYAA